MECSPRGRGMTGQASCLLVLPSPPAREAPRSYFATVYPVSSSTSSIFASVTISGS
jgi:hypothetical protein